MTEEQITKIYTLLAATTLKFVTITPKNIINIIFKRNDEGDNSPLPVSLQPFTASIALFNNMVKLSEYMDKITLENQDISKSPERV